MDRAEFLRDVRDLFETTVDREGLEYDRVIYRVERPLRQGVVAHVRSFLDGDGGDIEDDAVAHAVDEAVGNVHYPDTSPLLKLQPEGFTLPEAVAVLHFYQPHFPLYREAAVDALQGLGYDVAWTTDLTEAGLAAYGDYEQSIQDLMDGLHFRHVPEIHCYRQRVVEGALTALQRRET